MERAAEASLLAMIRGHKTENLICWPLLHTRGDPPHPCAQAVIVTVCCAVHRVAGTKFLVTRRRKDPRTSEHFAKPPTTSVYSVSSPLCSPARVPRLPVVFCYSRCKAHKFFCGFVCLQRFPPTRQQLWMRFRLRSRFRTAQAPMGSVQDLLCSCPLR